MRTSLAVALLMCIIMIAGCSSVDRLTSSPIYDQTSEEPLALLSGNQLQDSGTAALGVFHGIIDLKQLTAELIPSRNASKIGDVFDADITQFLEKSPCWNCVRIQSVNVDASGYLHLSMAIKHPVSNATARPDLHAFDVRGIMILPSDTNFPLTYPIPGGTTEEALSGNTRLLTNADGMTTHFDNLAEDPNYFNPPIVIPGNLNPYIRYFVNPDTPAFDPFNPSGHNVFPVAGNWRAKEYILDTRSSASIIEFVFVVDASYGQSAVLANRSNPYYFLPNFNRKEAWQVDVSLPVNSLVAAKPDSSAQVMAEVYDWQAGRTVDANYPDTTHLGGIPYKSDVASVWFSAPDLFDTPISVNTPGSGSGVWGDPYVFTLDFQNTKMANVGSHVGLICVRDDLWGTSGPNAIPQPPIGFPFAGPDIRDYATYKVVNILIADPWDLRPDPFPGDYQVFYGGRTAKGDFNNDGILDLAVAAQGADPSGTVFAYFGNGNGFNTTPVALLISGSEFSAFGTSLDVADMNADNYDDIVASSYHGGLGIFLSDGAGGFQSPISRTVPYSSADYFGTVLHIGKMNYDSFPDIVTNAYSADVGLTINAGKILTFMFDGSSILDAVEITQDIPTASAYYGFEFNVSDLDNNTISDLLVKYDCELFPGEFDNVDIVYTNGSGSAFLRQSLRGKFPYLGSRSIGSSVTTVDLNGDTIEEWIIGAHSNTVSGYTSAGEFFIFYPDSNGGFRGYSRFQNANPARGNSIANAPVETGDINGDGALDLIVPGPSSSEGSVQLFLAVPGTYEFYKEITEPVPPGLTMTFGLSVLGMNIDSNSDDEVLIGSNTDNWMGHLYVYFNP